MKKLFALLAIVSLTACSNHDQQPYPPQYQQQAPVVVQQAPAQAPVVVQQESHDGTALVAGAALGAVAAMALTDRNPGYQGPGYQNQPAVSQNVTHVTQVNKTVIVHNGDKVVNNGSTKDVPPAPAATATPTPAPNAPAPAGVNLAKDVPTAKPNYAAAGTQSPVPSMSQAALTAPKTLNVPSATPNAAVPNYKPANYAQVGYNKPAALPALPAPKPAPAPAPLRLSYSPPKASTPAISYKPSGKK